MIGQHITVQTSTNSVSVLSQASHPVALPVASAIFVRLVREMHVSVM